MPSLPKESSTDTEICLFIFAVLSLAINRWINSCAALHTSSLFSYLFPRQNPFNFHPKHHKLWYLLNFAYVVSSAWEAHQPLLYLLTSLHQLRHIHATPSVMKSLCSLVCFIIHVVVPLPVKHNLWVPESLPINLPIPRTWPSDWHSRGIQ